MSTFGAIGEYAIGEVPSGTTTVDTFVWYQQWAEPPRPAARLHPGANQALGYQPTPIISMAWFEQLSEPRRFARMLQPTGQPFDAFVPDLRYISIGWYEPLSEPRRYPSGLRASDNPDMFRAIPPFQLPYARGYVIT